MATAQKVGGSRGATWGTLAAQKVEIPPGKNKKDFGWLNTDSHRVTINMICE
jgi:hypothetical protein